MLEASEDNYTFCKYKLVTAIKTQFPLIRYRIYLHNKQIRNKEGEKYKSIVKLQNFKENFETIVY